MRFSDRLRNLPRYAREFPTYLRGWARATTEWGDPIEVPFPEFRSVVETGRITGHGEEQVLAFLKENLRPGAVFFDIGANAGFYTLLGAHLGAEVHAFEPFPSTFAKLQANTAGKDSVRLYQCAVSDAAGELSMRKEKRPGLNKVSADGDVPVQSVTLDSFGVVPTIMKVDVEGHELSVFRGGREMLSKHHPLIVAEVTDESRDYLVSLGYEATLLGKVNYAFTPKR